VYYYTQITKRVHAVVLADIKAQCNMLQNKQAMKRRRNRLESR